jgi:hypothetical protein
MSPAGIYPKQSLKLIATLATQEVLLKVEITANIESL